MKSFRLGWMILFSLVLATGCELDGPAAEPKPEPPAGLIQIDATSDDTWVFFDLDTARTTDEDSGWDLAFRRQWIASNGGADVAVALLDGVRFEDVTKAPEDGYVRDGEDRSEPNLPNFAFHREGEWFAYDMATHQLTPRKNRVYVVLSTEGKAYAIRMVDYYDAAGTSGYPTFEMKEIEPPDSAVEPEEPEEPGEEPEEPEIPEDAIVVDATDSEAWVYFDLDTLEVVEEASDWELAFRRQWIATNGPGGVRVALVDGVDLEDVTEAPEDGYTADDFELTDENLPDLAFHGESDWFEYDTTTHRLFARKRVYVVVNAEEKAFAVQLLSYYKDGEAGHPTFVVKELGEETPLPGPEFTEVVIDATDAEEWVYFDLDSGETTGIDAGWDLAFRRSLIGVDGDAGVKVAILDGIGLEEVEAIPEDGYRADEVDIWDPEISDRDKEAGLAFHQEGGWYEYDMTTHRLSPRERVHVVISTEGKAFAVQMVSYYDENGTSGFPAFRFMEIE